MVRATDGAKLDLEELKAVDLVLRSFASKLAAHAVKWFSDNQNVIRIVQAGSRQPHLQHGAMSIFEICWKHGIGWRWLGFLEASMIEQTILVALSISMIGG